jgi:hypothetical protein
MSGVDQMAHLKEKTRDTFGMARPPSVTQSQPSRPSNHSSQKDSVKLHSNGLVEILKSTEKRASQRIPADGLSQSGLMGNSYQRNTPNMRKQASNSRIGPMSQSRQVNPSALMINQLLDEAVKVIHVPQDLSRLPRMTAENTPETSQLSRDVMNRSISLSVHEMQNKVHQHERQKYENTLKMNLIALLEALGISDSESFISSYPTMEEVALHIRRHLTQSNPAQRSASVSSRIIKNQGTSKDMNDDADLTKENKRLKELVVKLQFEVTENFKKSTETRIRELYEENQNFQRKIADLIDQLKRKEQEILLIPIGKVAQNRIDIVEAEKRDLMKLLDEAKRAHQQEVAELNDKLLTAGSKNTQFVPIDDGVFLDPYLMQSLMEQKALVEELSLLILTLRAERDSLEASVLSLSREKREYEKTTVLFENFLKHQGFDTVSLLATLDSPPNPNSFLPEPANDPVRELREIKSQLSRMKEESKKSLL